VTALYESRVAADAASEKLKVFAQPQRLMILSCLLRGEKTVGDTETATGIGQPALSQQLAELRRAGMVKTRRSAKQIYYALADETVVLCVRSMEAMFGGSENPAEALEAALMREPPATPSKTRPPGVAAFARIG
jgi:DNA-binding transcriptional ArsR family regulator